jgi:Rrf2 family protein
VKFSTKTRYGIRTMLEIALDTAQKGLLQKDIAINQDISVKYLDYIIHALKVAGLITNAKGKKSGYVLAKDPSTVTMYDIHNAFEPGICIVDCLTQDMNCLRGSKCSVRFFWTGLNSMIIGYLKKTTLADLVKEDFKRRELLNVIKNKLPDDITLMLG